LKYYVQPVPLVPIVVYHVACMGNWREVIREQFLMLRESGLAAALSEIGDGVRLSHVGGNLQDVLDEAARQDVPVQVISSCPDLQKFEIPAMLEIDRLAKVDRVQRPILYMHTKGVSAPDDKVRETWRRAMGFHTVSKWRENLGHLRTHDAAGMDYWFNHPAHPHFHGTFWMATADWIRELKSFEEFNRTGGNGRFSAEIWIGKAARPCRAYSHLLHDEQIDVPGFDMSRIDPPAYLTTKTITWVSAATPKYYGDLEALEKSAELLGPGHKTDFRRLPETPWKHTRKFGLLRETIARADTTHVFWVDADCEFLTILRPTDFIGDRPLSCVRHLAYSDPRPIIPTYLQSRLPPNPGETYWQVCLWGGQKDAVLEVLDGAKWFEDDPRGYDEHALNIWFCSHPEKIHTLPCRYAAPSSFKGMLPTEKTSYFERSGGSPRVVHHNSDISGRNR
ncbi:MAG: hypothetical protein KGJ61_09715, partial [Candidatus Omnitrophica bacterium]|nr:hypothetical protein [Candidatus Omnitrophota bacterium]